MKGWRGYKGKQWEQAPIREAYGRTLADLGREDEKIVVLTADVANSTMTKYFRDEFPDRHFEMGIAEQDMVAAAAGLASMGFKVFCSAFAMFLTGRAWDQARNSVAYSRWPVTLAATHAGVTVGQDGPTHQAAEDFALMRSIAGMSVVAPCDYHETVRVTRWAANFDGPVYFRMGRETVPHVTGPDTPFEFGKALTMREGSDATIIANGLLVAKSLEAAEEMEKSGVSVRVLNMHTVKPVDQQAVAKAAAETGIIVVAEEHNIHGGLGDAVAQVAVQLDRPPLMRLVAIEDQFLDSALPHELMEMAGLTVENITAKLKSALDIKAGARL
jgi:transketolase